jgi:hypothetical protein
VNALTFGRSALAPPTKVRRPLTSFYFFFPSTSTSTSPHQSFKFFPQNTLNCFCQLYTTTTKFKSFRNPSPIMDAPLAMTFVVAILTQEVASGNHDVFVDRLIQDAIDASGMQLVEQQLSVNMGHDFDIQRNPACNLLHVHLKAPRSQISTQHEVDNFHSTQPRQTITTTIAAGRTKPPRPTNKFIMYRKLQHKKFKDLNPDLSCIQICKFHSPSIRLLHRCAPC